MFNLVETIPFALGAAASIFGFSFFGFFASRLPCRSLLFIVKSSSASLAEIIERRRPPSHGAPGRSRSGRPRAGSSTLPHCLFELFFDAGRTSPGEGVIHVRGRHVFHEFADNV